MPKRARAQTLTDVSDMLGLVNILDYNDHGKAVSFHDIDGDGWDDLSIATESGPPVFYLNQQGVMVPAPFSIPNPQGSKINMLLWADFNNDGIKELLISKYVGPVELWQNDGNWQFTNISAMAGIHQTWHTHGGAAVADFNHDGCLDIYVARLPGSGMDPTDPAYQGVLYRGNCDLTFTDVTVAAGLISSPRPTFMPLFLDHDSDGWEDLLLIVDRTDFSNKLYRNSGNGTFTDVSMASGMDVHEDAMTGTVGDPDNDGDLDVFITNTPQEGGHLMMVNQGDGTYEDQATQLGLGTIAMGWGGMWMDLDNDGWEDLFVSITNTPQFMSGNQFFMNQQGTTFQDASAQVGLWDNVIETYSVARGDLDNDGYHDLITNNRAPHNTVLYRTNGGQGHFLSFTLQGVLANRDGIGSWVRCYAGGLQQVRYTQCGSDYMAQSSGRYIFGLGSGTLVDSLVIEWNSGTRDVYRDLVADQHLHFIEGGSLIVTITPLGEPFICPGDSVVLDAGEHAFYAWNTGHTGRELTVTEAGTYYVTVQSIPGISATSDPVVVVVHPMPILEIAVVHPSCAGSANGTIQLINLTGIPPALVEWGNGHSGPSIDQLEEGIYTFTFMDANGCTTAGNAQLIAPPILDVLTESTPEQLGGDATITVFAFGGSPPFAVQVNGMSTSSFINGLSAGSYDVEVTDQQGCTTSTTVLIDDHTMVITIGTPSVQVFPNPTMDRLSLLFTGPVDHLIMTDLEGRVVLQKNAPLDPFLDIGHLVPGMYILLVGTNGRSVHRSTVIRLDE